MNHYGKEKWRKKNKFAKSRCRPKSIAEGRKKATNINKEGDTWLIKKKKDYICGLIKEGIINN